jgi:hypothetical protein
LNGWGFERRATYIVDQYNGKGGNIRAYSLPSEGVGAGARPVGALCRGGDGVCEGGDDKQECGEQHRETGHVDADARSEEDASWVRAGCGLVGRGKRVQGFKKRDTVLVANAVPASRQGCHPKRPNPVSANTGPEF